MRRFLRRACPWLLPTAVIVSGCSTYQAKPLDSAAKPPESRVDTIEQIKVEAAHIQHPILKPVVIDGRTGLTPDEIAVMAVVANPQLRAARDQRGIAQAQVVQAGLLPNPQLAYAVDFPTTPGYVDAKTFGLSWEVTALFGYQDRIASAKATAKSVDLGIAWQEWQVAQEARLHAFRVLSLEARLRLARESEDDLAEARGLVEQAFQERHRTITDMAAATEAWSSAQDNRLTLAQELASERSSLNLALGRPGEADLQLKEGAEFPELSEDAASASKLLQGLESRRLDLLALAAGYESTEAALRAAVRAQFPKLTVNLSRANDTSDVSTRGFGVTMDLPVFDRNQGQIAAGLATRQQLFDDYAARVAEARSSVFTILADLHAAHERLDAVEARLPELETLVTALDRAVRLRDAEMTAWRDAHGSLLERRSEEARLRQEIFELGVALETATGRPLLNRHASL